MTSLIFKVFSANFISLFFLFCQHIQMLKWGKIWLHLSSEHLDLPLLHVLVHNTDDPADQVPLCLGVLWAGVPQPVPSHHPRHGHPHPDRHPRLRPLHTAAAPQWLWPRPLEIQPDIPEVTAAEGLFCHLWLLTNVRQDAHHSYTTITYTTAVFTVIQSFILEYCSTFSKFWTTSKLQ